MADKNDSYHQKATALYRRLKSEAVQYVTSDYVLDEVITALFRAVPFEQAVRFIEAIVKLRDGNKLIIEPVTPIIFDDAWTLRKKYQDKPVISSTDFTSFSIMRKLNISRVFTGDVHFESVNLGFVLEK
ncbi:PIN domain-containing protein [candidate division KSB1 bacterium]|nr:PIN domain-containing protein [candidate division KSB1 bacterium]